MVKSSVLEFHETFQPEMTYIAKILKLASENYAGTKFEISDCTGIPTGKQKAKLSPIFATHASWDWLTTP